MTFPLCILIDGIISNVCAESTIKEVLVDIWPAAVVKVVEEVVVVVVV